LESPAAATAAAQPAVYPGTQPILLSREAAERHLRQSGSGQGGGWFSWLFGGK